MNTFEGRLEKALAVAMIVFLGTTGTGLCLFMFAAVFGDPPPQNEGCGKCWCEVVE